MRLENILALTHAKLLSSPFVSEFNKIVFRAKDVTRGDLFFAYDPLQIEEAVANGAYGIVFDKKAQISDQEIAWIKVENLDEALKRILRFKLIDKKIEVYGCDAITLKLALQIITEPSFLALNGTFVDIYNDLDMLDDGATVLFSPELISSELFTKVKHLPQNPSLHIDVVEQTLFESSFIYDNVFYERQLISPFFIPYLEQLLHLLKVLGINFRLRKFTPIDHFEAVFTNKNFEIKEFGTSDKVLIFEKSTSFANKEISYLQKQAFWAKNLYVLPQSALENIDQNLLNGMQVAIYNKKHEIKALLKEHQFHFALIIGADKSILMQSLQLTPKTLFDF
ncbi:MAG: hypothetical protein FAF05_00310 [Epsilonproteobacteria bacterium]|nr:hypothetical protein [Campylobacterota bacterium]